MNCVDIATVSTLPLRCGQACYQGAAAPDWTYVLRVMVKRLREQMHHMAEDICDSFAIAMPTSSYTAMPT